MVEQSLFFNSTMNNRRRYGASDIANYWRSFLSTGLIHKDGEPTLRVRANGENMTVNYDDGRALMFGHLYRKKGEKPFTLTPSAANEDRFDRIVLRLDNIRGEDDSRFIKTFLKEGTADGPPELTRTFIEDEPVVYELSLAQIHVKAGKSYIEQSDIIDERFDKELCGLSSSLITVPTDEFQRQWNEWFYSIQNQSYITKGDYERMSQPLQREVANLNLHLEAEKRVKNGVTFGTNFDETFNMELPKFKGVIMHELTVGDTEITLNVPHDLKVGDRVTLFTPSQNEEVVIEGVDDNKLTVNPLINDYRGEQVNIASTMLKENKDGTFSFDDYYEIEEISQDGLLITSDGPTTSSSPGGSYNFNGYDVAVNSRGDIAKVYSTSEGKFSVALLKNGSNVINLGEFDGGRPQRYFSTQGVTFLDDDNLAISSVESGGSYQLYEIRTLHIPSLEVVTLSRDTGSANIQHLASYLSKDETFYLCSTHNRATMLHSCDLIESNGRITLREKDSVTINTTAESSHYSAFIESERYEGGFAVVTIRNYSTTGSDKQIEILYTYNGVWKKRGLVQRGEFQNLEGFKAFEVRGELKFLFLGTSATNIANMVLQELSIATNRTGTDITHTISDRKSIGSVISNSPKRTPAFSIGPNDEITVVYALGANLVQRKRNSLTGEWSEETQIVVTGAQPSIIPYTTFESETPLFFYMEATKIMKAYGKWANGVPTKLDYNDIRLKLNKSTDIVAWLDINSDVIDAHYNGELIETEVAKGEIQAWGFKSNEDEGRLTVRLKRPTPETPNDEIVLKQILGGIG